MESNTAVSALAALAQDSRLAVFRLLLRHFLLQPEGDDALDGDGFGLRKQLFLAKKGIEAAAHMLVH